MSAAQNPVVPRVSTSNSACTAARVFKLAFLVLLLLALYTQISAGLVRDWLALYLAWMDRRQTLAQSIVPNSRGLWMVGLSGALFVFGKLSATEFFSRIAMVICLAGMIWTFWGTARLLALGRPLVLLAAMVPPPALVIDRLTLPLRLLASTWATTIAQAAGISVNQDGNVIHLATISLGVADACSGLSSLLAMFVTALLISFMVCESLWLRAALALLSIPLAVIFNVIRIAGTALLADYQPEAAMGFYHLFSGWLVFVLGAVTVYGMAKLLARAG